MRKTLLSISNVHVCVHRDVRDVSVCVCVFVCICVCVCDMGMSGVLKNSKAGNKIGNGGIREELSVEITFEKD